MKLRIYHIPNVPGKPLEREVESIEEGQKLLALLADYDLHLGEDLIFSNVQGIQRFVDGEWEDLDEDEIAEAIGEE